MNISNVSSSPFQWNVKREAVVNQNGLTQMMPKIVQETLAPKEASIEPKKDTGIHVDIYA